MSSSTAQASFELANNIQAIDHVFRYDSEAQKAQLDARPWKKDPRHFKKVRISAVALIKMVMHARSGGEYEIMGLMQGKLDGDTIIVMDAFALPVVGTETRVNAQNEANEFMIQYIEGSKAIGRLENVVGWYHSHPGYGCWLSGIDVQTQMTHQEFEDPFLAVVIDPNRTVSAGRVDIGAFRTYPNGYTPPNATASEFQSIPLNKIEDFGVHANSYYPLEVEHFKSTRDAELLNLLWNKYWVMTLSNSPLVTNRAFQTSQTVDLVEKLSRTEQSLNHRCGIASMAPVLIEARTRANASGSTGPPLGPLGSPSKGKQASKDDAGPPGLVAPSQKKEEETALAQAVKETTKMSAEASQGLIGALVKDALFNGGQLAGGKPGEPATFAMPPLLL